MGPVEEPDEYDALYGSHLWHAVMHHFFAASPRAHGSRLRGKFDGRMGDVANLRMRWIIEQA